LESPGLTQTLGHAFGENNPGDENNDERIENVFPPVMKMLVKEMLPMRREKTADKGE